MFRLILSLAAAAFLAAGAVARADEPVSLSSLYDKLSQAGTREEATLIEAAIWERWMESGSPSTDLLLSRGLEAMADDDFDTAGKLFDAVVDISPKFAEGWNKRATLHFLAEDYELALVDIRQVLALEPRHFGALAALGKILESFGDKKHALEAYRQALAVNPYLEGIAEDAKRLEPEVDGRGI